MTETKMKHASLAAALAAFQADLPGVGKDSTNPHFKSKYADLADMSKAILPALAVQGLSFTSAPTLTDRGFVLAYSLLHESGESITGEYPLNSAGNEQQKGSSITYARRYALGAVTGAAADDDDGNAASQAKQVQPPSNWRKLIVDAPNQDVLTGIYQRATGEGWAVPEVMQALTSRKTALQTELQSAPADA
ncbi:MAG: ERF family protein [Leucobacter sp.]